MSSKPSRAAPPPPIPSHAKNDRNNNRNNQRQLRDGVAKIPTVIRPKMVETPKKRAPPRPPPPLMDASFVPTRTSSLNRGVPPPVPPPPTNKPSKQRGLHINTKALRKVKIFGKSSSKSASSNANEEFFTATMGNGRFGGSYTNQALSQPPRGKKQAPMPPHGLANFPSSERVATGTLISFDTPPTSPSSAIPPLANGSQNVQSLLDMDFPEPSKTGGASLLDMDIPPMISTSLSVDNFGSTPFDPFKNENPRKASLPVVTSKNVQPVLKTPEPLSRISRIREEWSSPHESSPPPPRCPAPQLNPLDTSAVTTQPCGMALADHTNPKKGELAFSQYELIELLNEHDDVHFMGRLDDQEGLVRKDAVEVLTPLEDSQQDSEPESQQDTVYRQRPSSSTSTGDDKPETERYILQKPVASVSPFPTQMSQSEDAEHAVALYDFEAQHEDELSFNAGDQLLVTSRCDNDWLYGCTVKDSRFGIFPVSFVLIGSESGSETESLKEVEEAGDCELQNRVAQEGKQIGPINGSSNGRPVIAIFAFSPEQEGDLSLQEGESITVLSRINKDWLMGRNSKGETGQFPATFVQLSDSMDSNSTKASAESEVYICVFDFEAQQTDDLTIRVGDKIRVTEKVSEEWWQGHVLGEKAEGIFPSTFVEPM